MLAVVAAEDAERLIASLSENGELATMVGALVDRADEAVTFEGTLRL
jgi:hypothetical protein